MHSPGSHHAAQLDAYPYIFSLGHPCSAQPLLFSTKFLSTCWIQHPCHALLTERECSQEKEPEEHSATGSASELHGGAHQAGWQGQRDSSAPLQNGIRDKAQHRPAASEKGQSPDPSRQASGNFSLQSSLSEPMPGQLGSGQDGAAAPNPSGRGKGSSISGSEPELRRESASQVELAARAVEAREAEKERLRYASSNRVLMCNLESADIVIALCRFRIW